MVYYGVEDEYFKKEEIQMTRLSSYELYLAYRMSQLANDLYYVKSNASDFKRAQESQKKFIEMRYYELNRTIENLIEYIYTISNAGNKDLKNEIEVYKKLKSKWKSCALKSD